MTTGRLEVATEADLPAVMMIERAEGYGAHVGRDTLEQHRAWLASDEAEHLLWREPDGRVAAFAILRKLTDRNGVVLLKRIAAARAGGGAGQPFLRAVIERVFARPQAYRLELTVREGNERAQHVYRKLGFASEGLLRGNWRDADGVRHASVMMSLLRPEWEAFR